MNSSGIKRGLAATAVAAMAVTGLPFFASSASAVTGDEIVIGSVGATLNGGTAGGVVVLKTKNISEAEAEGVIADPATAALKLVNTTLNGTPNNANQTVSIVGVPVWTADASDSHPNDGYDEVAVHVAVTTPAAGDTANYAIYLDDNDDDAVAAAEARAQVSQQTSGALAALAVSPTVQTAPLGVESGAYTVTYKDSAGRTTQPTVDTVLSVASGGTATFNATPITPTQAELGTATFKATGTTTTGLRNISIDTGAVHAAAQLDVIAAASGITADEVDFVTGADSWDGFGGDTYGNGVAVRTDQTSVKLDIKSPTNAGKVVSITATGTGLTFGTKAAQTQTVTLDGSGVGSLTFTPDAGTIQDTDSFTVVGAGINTTVTYEAPAISANEVTPDAVTYLSSFGGSVTATVTVTDQFGTPAAGTYVTVRRTGGVNADATESARKLVGDDGKVSFTLTDTKATAASHASDTLSFKVYSGQFDATALATDVSSHIDYTATGQGAEFFFTVDGTLPAGTGYDPNGTFANPLTDTTADDAGDSTDESIALNIVGGTNSAAVTVGVDNGALILKNGETRLAQGSASDSGVLGTDTFKIIGTKTGLVNVTITSGGITHTAQVSVHSGAEATPPVSTAFSARNVEVSGPEKAAAGDTAEFTVKVTDAFGNPVFGVPTASLAKLVGGDAQVIGDSGSTNAAGELTVQVSLDNDADSPVSLQVTGSGFDFGAAANRLTAASTTDDGTGLTASVATDSATVTDVVNIEKLQAAVDAAQAKVDSAQDNLAAARGDLRVAKAERSVARQAVKQAKKELRQAKRHHHGVKAARKELRQARGDLRIARAKVSAEQATVNRAKDRLAAAQAELEAAQQALEDAQAEG